jgi:hypothetical protein
MFSFVHITSYPLDTLPVKAAFEIMTCLLYERTGSLLPGIALHSFVDASAIDVSLSGNDLIVLAKLSVPRGGAAHPGHQARLYRDDPPGPVRRDFGAASMISRLWASPP